MTIRSTTGRGLIAFVVLLLVAGTALAVGPSASPSASPESSASAAASASSAPPSASPRAAATASAKAKASEAPDASEAPEVAESPDGSDGPPSADEIARIVGLLKDAGITATAAQLQDLAGKVGVGGAVRVYAFAHASGKTPAQILALFQSGKGWGQIDHELGLSIGPGIGWIMGHGHGQGHGKGPKN
jgi:hypothetical protein